MSWASGPLLATVGYSWALTKNGDHFCWQASLGPPTALLWPLKPQPGPVLEDRGTAAGCGLEHPIQRALCHGRCHTHFRSEQSEAKTPALSLHHRASWDAVCGEGAQTRFAWEIRAFLMFPNQGQSSLSVSLCRQSRGLQP